MLLSLLLNYLLAVADSAHVYHSSTLPQQRRPLWAARQDTIVFSLLLSPLHTAVQKHVHSTVTGAVYARIVG